MPRLRTAVHGRHSLRVHAQGNALEAFAPFTLCEDRLDLFFAFGLNDARYREKAVVEEALVVERLARGELRGCQCADMIDL